MVGSSAVSVVAGAREIEDRPGLALWAGRFDGVRGFRLDSDFETGPGTEIEDQLADAHGLVLLTDPYTFPVDRLVDHIAEHHPRVAVVGGLASATVGPQQQLLIHDSDAHHDGAVGFALSGSTRMEPVVSQGCRPIGSPMIVTAAEDNLISELAGQPALRRLQDLVEGLPEDERVLAAGGLHLGRVVNEHQADFGRGDFLIRGVLGVNRDTDALAVGDRIPVGSTVQFQVRDASSADTDLHQLLADRGSRGDAALLFTCNGRGSHLFQTPDHDAGAVAEHLDGAPLAGMFCAGEIGPIGGRSFLHGFTASIAIFTED
jgi:small ligand-binding sensory domain FIST